MTAHPEPHSRLMDEAIAQRSRCFLMLPKPVTGIRELNCAILESTPQGIVLESAEKATVGSHWVGQPVKGYFRVVVQRGQGATFYTFDSRIREATANASGQARLRVCEPAALFIGQRRKSLRVEPTLEHLQSAFFWRYDAQEGFKMDAPILTEKDFHTGVARLANISAGGLRLCVRASKTSQQAMQVKLGDRLVIHLELLEPRVPGPHEFWMVARVCYTRAERPGQDLSLGVEFLANGVLDAAVGKMRWKPVVEHVIPELTEIFFLWDLDKYRESMA